MSNPPGRMKVSIRQVLASAVGAVVAATIASFFGVNGTIVGVAIGSAAATIGTALVAQSIERTHDAVRQVVVRAPDASLLRRLGGTNAAGAVTESAPEADVPVAEAARANEARGDESAMTVIPSPGPRTAVLPRVAPRAGAPRKLNWRVVAVTSVIVFVLVLGLITVVELVAGKPLSDVFGGKQGNGTSLLGPSSTTKQPTTTTTTVPTTTTSTTSAGSTTSTTGRSTTTTTSVAATTTTSVPTTSTTLGSPTTTSGAG
jgi:hypothetical protein